jgi:hypothetical protein
MPAAACAILRAAPGRTSTAPDAAALNGWHPNAASASWLAKPSASGGAPATASERVSPADQVLTSTRRPLRMTWIGQRSRSAVGIRSVAIERRSDLAEPLCAQPAPVWELVASIPAPRCDHHQHQDPALA